MLGSRSEVLWETTESADIGVQYQWLDTESPPKISQPKLLSSSRLQNAVGSSSHKDYVRLRKALCHVDYRSRMA